MITPPRHPARSPALLTRLLGPGPARAAELFRIAENEGISERTLRCLKARDGIESLKIGDPWWWRHPSQDGQDGQGGHDPNAAADPAHLDCHPDARAMIPGQGCQP